MQFNLNVRNLAQLAESAAARAPEANYGTDTTAAPLAEALQTARGLARQLAVAGLRRDATLAFVGVTSEHYLVLWLAAQLMGVRTALINPHYPGELLDAMLLDLQPDAVAWFDSEQAVPGAGRWPVIDAGQAWQGQVRVVQGCIDAATSSAAGDAAEWGQACQGADIACYMHTSGTSGRPKFCALSHAYFLKLGRFIADSLGYVKGDVVYAPMPMFHINPLGYGVVAAWTAAAGVIGARRFSTANFWPIVKRIRASAVILHVTPQKMLLNDTTAQDSAGHRIRAVFFATDELLRRFEIPVGVTVYGSTEAGGLCHLWHVRCGDQILAPEGQTAYAGRARFDIEATIASDGEILVRERSPQSLFSGYLRDGVIDPSVDEQGWFHTGDRGRIDALGNLVFIERMSEAIRVNGEYVPIDFVEERLERDAGLKEFAIWSRPDALSGQRVVLWVAGAQPDMPRLTSAIHALPAIMRPVEVIGIEQLPRDTGVHKIQRRRLHDMPVCWRYAVAPK